MTVFAQGADGEQSPATYGLVAAMLPEPELPRQPYEANDRPSADSPGVLTTNTNNKGASAPLSLFAQENQQSSGGFDWFERFHVLPRSFDFGNILSAQSTPIEVFNAFRHDTKEWTSFVNGAGAGTELGGLPALPTNLAPLNGIPMTVDVSATGDPFVDATLDFGFTGLGTIFVPIEIQRIVLWGATPEQEYIEELAFLTNVYPSKDGTEKRESVRKSPRQSWNYQYKIDEGLDAQTLENRLFDFHARTFGVPVWFDDADMTVAAAAGVSVITVEATGIRDFRVGGLVVIFTSQTIFDVLEIASGGITGTTLTFTSVTINAYVVGTKVYPLATCFVPPQVSGARWPVNLQRQDVRFSAIDNDVDLADLSAFSSFNSKLLLDNGNSMRGSTVGHGYRMDLVKIDSGSGLLFQESPWDRHKRSYLFTLRADGRQEVWDMRRMIHAIKGQWTSFYIPRDSDDLALVANLSSGADTLDVTNVGYAQFIRNRQPKNVIRVNFVDGSTPLLRTIIGSTSPSTTVDQLQVDSNWPATFTPAEISRIEYVEKIRFATDRMQIRYDPVALRARLSAPVQAVFE